MTDSLESDNIGMHFLIKFIIYLRTYIWAEFELQSLYTHLISALVFHRPQIYVKMGKVKHNGGVFFYLVFAMTVFIWWVIKMNERELHWI